MIESKDKYGIVMKLLAIAIFILLLITIALSVAIVNSKDNEQVVQPIDIIYHNDGPETKIRYKYIAEYETVDDELSERTNGAPIYSLYVNNLEVSSAYGDYEMSIPSVSETITVGKNETLTSDFHIELNELVDKDLIRIDVKIIIEELKKGKWAPVYQVVFMERGPYWSLDKGPIEILMTETD